MGDILVLEGLFQRIRARVESSEEADAAATMLKISNAPVMVARMPFGKHKGQKMDQVPTDYLNWLKKTDIDEDLAFTVQYHLRPKQ